MYVYIQPPSHPFRSLPLPSFLPSFDPSTFRPFRASAYVTFISFSSFFFFLLRNGYDLEFSNIELSLFIRRYNSFNLYFEEERMFWIIFSWFFQIFKSFLENINKWKKRTAIKIIALNIDIIVITNNRETNITTLFENEPSLTVRLRWMDLYNRFFSFFLSSSLFELNPFSDPRHGRKRK